MPKNSGSRKGMKSRKAPTAYEDFLGAKRTALRALSVFKGAALLLNAEFKVKSKNDTLGPTTTPVLTVLSGLAQGDGGDNRDGNSVKIAKLQVRMRISSNAAAALTRTRIILFCDTRNAGANPTSSSVVDTSFSVQQWPNVEAEPGRFVILSDKLFVTSIANSYRHPFLVSDEVTLDEVAGAHLGFNGTAVSVASCRGLAVFAMVVSDQATNAPVVDLMTRMFYLDN